MELKTDDGRELNHAGGVVAVYVGQA